MRTRSLYLTGALVVAGVAAWALSGVFAEDPGHATRLDGAHAPAGASYARIRAEAEEARPAAEAPPGEVAATAEADAEGGAARPDAEAAPEPASRTLVRGVVLGADGLPRAGAQVWLTVPSRRRRPTRLELSTDALGRFQGEVRPGQLWIEIRASDHVRSQRGAEVAGAVHDLGELRLERGARLVGKVTDPAGRPLAGARVRVAGDRRGGGGGAESDAQGAFALNLREGVYRVSAEAQGFVRTELEQVVVTEAQGGEVALALQRGGRLSGTVYQPDGAAQAGAQLFVYRGGERLGETRADEQGAYGLDGLAPGPVEVFVRSGDRGLSCRVPLQISAREQRQDFVLHEAARIEGRLTTPDGEPLAGLRVRAVELQGDVRRDAESDADGRFAVANLYPGVYRLEVLRRGQRPLEGGEVEVARGVVTQDVVVPRGAQVSGRVEGPTGEPLVNAGVFAIKDGDYLGQTQTDDAGAFALGDLPPGSYRLFVRGREDGLVALRPLELGPDTTLEGLSLVARAPATLHGKVVGPSGEGLAGIVVRLRATDAPVDRRARTQPDGSFELGPLYDGHYEGELSGDALALLSAKLGRELEAPEVELTIQNGRDAEQVWVVR